MPQRAGYCPVVNAARDGEQIGELTQNWVKRMPSAARRSRWGVSAPAPP